MTSVRPCEHGVPNGIGCERCGKVPSIFPAERVRLFGEVDTRWGYLLPVWLESQLIEEQGLKPWKTLLTIVEGDAAPCRDDILLDTSSGYRKPQVLVGLGWIRREHPDVWKGMLAAKLRGPLHA